MLGVPLIHKHHEEWRLRQPTYTPHQHRQLFTACVNPTHPFRFTDLQTQKQVSTGPAGREQALNVGFRFVFLFCWCACVVCILCKKWKNKEKGCVCVCVLYCKFCNRYYIAVVLCTPFSLAIQHSLCEGHSLIVPASRHRQWNSAHHSCWLSAPALTVFLRLFFTLNYTYDGLLTCGRYQWNSADHSCWSSSVQSVRAVV